jgi:hypothetical protein
MSGAAGGTPPAGGAEARRNPPSAPVAFAQVIVCAIVAPLAAGHERR